MCLRIEAAELYCRLMANQEARTMLSEFMNRLRVPLLMTMAAAFACECRGNPREYMPNPSKSNQVEWLELVASRWDAAAAYATNVYHRDGDVRELRGSAYARLGELATPESLAAIARIEAEAKSTRPAYGEERFDWEPGPTFHFASDDREPLAKTKHLDGRWYALVLSIRFGIHRPLLLAASEEPAPRWERGHLLPFACSGTEKEPILLSFDQNTLVFRHRTWYGHSKTRIRLSEVMRDKDGDGWTDLEERQLGLDPRKADTDGDGIPDGADVTPNYAPPASEAEDEEVQILQRAFFATFGMSGSRELLAANPNSKTATSRGTRQIQLWGYPGVVLYRKSMYQWSRDTRPLARCWVGWGATINGERAEVTVSDWEGNMAAGWERVFFKKIQGQWYVVGIDPRKAVS